MRDAMHETDQRNGFKIVAGSGGSVAVVIGGSLLRWSISWI